MSIVASLLALVGKSSDGVWIDIHIECLNYLLEQVDKSIRIGLIDIQLLY